MRINLIIAIMLAPLLLTACTPKTPANTHTPRINTDLAGFFDCVRETRKVILSAHRGGPADGFAENTISTFQHTLDGGFVMLEMDVRQSADGKLYLYHDDALGRVGVGHGQVNKMDWAALSQVVLKDDSGHTTDQHMPLFKNVLVWARQKPVLLSIDFKPGLDRAKVLEMIRKTGMSQRVVLISYTEQQARDLVQMAPGMMISVGGLKSGPLTHILQNPAQTGSSKYMLAWMGTEAIKPVLIAKWRGKGIEPIQGTMGQLDRFFGSRPGNRGYAVLANEGVVVLATNRIDFVRTELNTRTNPLDRCALPPIKG